MIDLIFASFYGIYPCDMRYAKEYRCYTKKNPKKSTAEFYNGYNTNH